jgi:hypothetical protein
MNEKFNTILVKTQFLSIKCVVRYIYPSVVKEVHKSDIKQILPGQPFNINLTCCFSLICKFFKSALRAFLEISGASGYKYFIISLMPSYSTNRKGKLCLMTEATNSSLNFLGQNLELLTDRDP